MLTVTIFNQKAGVGSTTTTLNIAGAFSRQNRQAIIVDMDPQAHLTEMYKNQGLDPQKNLFRFFQSRTPLIDLIQKLDEHMFVVTTDATLTKLDNQFGRGLATLKLFTEGLDALAMNRRGASVFVDCCPYHGVISLNALIASDLVLVPVSADYLSIHATVKVDKALNALEPVIKRRIQRRYLITRFDKRKEMAKEVEQELRRLFGGDVLLTKISEDAALTESARNGKHIFDYDAQSTGALDHMALYFEIQDAFKQFPAAKLTG